MSALEASADQCNDATISAGSSILNYVLTLAIVLSYFPQYQRIISRGSSYGVSPLFIIFTFTFTTSAFANVLLLKSSNGGVDCCSVGSVHDWSCFTSLALIGQSGLQWLGSVVLLIIYLIFYPRPSTPTPPSSLRNSISSASTLTHPHRTSLPKPSLSSSSRRSSPFSSTTITAADDDDDHHEPNKPPPLPLPLKILPPLPILITLLVLLPPLLLAFNPTLLASHISLRSDWTFLTSTLTLLFATTQYLPQLLTTFRLKRLAGLSLFSVGVQVPVFLALGVFLALTMPVGPPAVEPPQQEGGEAALLGNSEGRHGHSRWWMVDGEQVVWMGYLVAGCVEALLLALGLHMWFWRETIQGREEAEGDEEFVVGVGVGEETPLLDGKGRDGGDLRVQEGWGEGVVRR